MMLRRVKLMSGWTSHRGLKKDFRKSGKRVKYSKELHDSLYIISKKHPTAKKKERCLSLHEHILKQPYHFVHQYRILICPESLNSIGRSFTSPNRLRICIHVPCSFLITIVLSNFPFCVVKKLKSGVKNCFIFLLPMSEPKSDASDRTSFELVTAEFLQF